MSNISIKMHKRVDFNFDEVLLSFVPNCLDAKVVNKEKCTNKL